MDETSDANTDPRNVLVTDLTHSLTGDEIKLLTKGPKFALAEPINEKTMIDFNVNFGRFAHQYRWKTALCNRNSEATSIFSQKYPWHIYLSMPPVDAAMESRLKRVYYGSKRVLETIKFTAKHI